MPEVSREVFEAAARMLDDEPIAEAPEVRVEDQEGDEPTEVEAADD